MRYKYSKIDYYCILYLHNDVSGTSKCLITTDVTNLPHQVLLLLYDGSVFCHKNVREKIVSDRENYAKNK